MKKLLLLSALLIFACSSDDDETPDICIDESLINLDYACTEEYDPVCGCDGNTYGNRCEASNFYGVISYTDGPCD